MLLTLSYLAFSVPCGCCCYFCQVIYHHIYLAISPLPPSYGGPAKSAWHYESHSLDFTGECERKKTTACPWSSFSDSAHQEALCPRSRMLFLLSSFPHCTDWKHKPLSNMKMDSGKCVADGNFAMLRGISAMRSALCHPYILLYSITGLIFFWSFQPNTHLLITYHQSKTARRVHLPFRLWKKNI